MRQIAAAAEFLMSKRKRAHDSAQHSSQMAERNAPRGDARPAQTLSGAGLTRLADWRVHAICVPVLLAITAGLAVHSLFGDSATFDEPSHLTAGMSFLKTGDFRLAPDHPPLAKIWAAAPLLLMDQHWPGPDVPSWEQCKQYDYGKKWLFELNDGDRLLIPARLMMVVLLLGTCVAVYALARTMFGPAAAFLALVLAAFSPTLLAHGRLVTTDLALALAAALVLLTFARLLRRISWPRLIAAAAALAALSLAKFSWPVVLVGPAVMIIFALARREPPEFTLFRQKPPESRNALPPLQGRWRRAGMIGLACFVLAGTTWLAIWTCYGWRFEMIPTRPISTPAGVVDANAGVRESYAKAWRQQVLGETGGPVKRARLALSDWGWNHHLLPAGYLYGFNWALRSAEARESYLMGEYSQAGRASYFPVAFAIKTPIAAMLLLAAGVCAIVRRPELRRRDPALLAGVVAFAAVYAIAAVASNINIGHRHLLPLYPLLDALAGAAVAWWSFRRARWAIGAALVWLVGANLWIHPHYVAYFNELVGGPSRGHKYLLDSNIDWGQDLKRLAGYAQSHAGEPMQLAYFGSAEPAAYGIACAALPSFWPFGAPAELTGGLYVLSVTQLFGVNDYAARDVFWAKPDTPASYREFAQAAARPPPPSQMTEARQAWESDRREFEQARRWRLMNQLQHRPPAERIGYSLFVYRLTQAEVDDLTRP